MEGGAELGSGRYLAMDSIAHGHLRRATEYRSKAEELRKIAATMSGDDTQTMFLGMATDYVHMAEVLERLAGE